MPSNQAATLNATPNAASHNNPLVEMFIDFFAGRRGTPAANRISVPPAA
jgi:hypothetical protein